MSRKIVYHIHADLKFAQRPTSLYPEHEFENRYVFLARKGDVCTPGLQGESFPHGLQAVEAVAGHMSDADVVVFYALDDLRARIANRMPAHVVLIWRFFGYELYERMPEFIFTETTRCCVSRAARIASLKRCLKGEWSIRGGMRRIKGICSRLFHGKSRGRQVAANTESDLQKALKRIDFFAGLADTEYDFLTRHFTLPPFLQLPYTSPLPQGYEKSKEPTVILGHSRIMYGNHLDILNILADVPSSVLEHYRFNAFFSYGAENAYTREVRRRASRFPTLQLLEGFMPIEEFSHCYDKAAALVIYAFRQVAMGNIFTALRAGAKVYLPAGNVMFEWLRREGFVLADVSDFKSDLMQGSVYLSEQEMEQNRTAWVGLTQKYTPKAFAARILAACERKATLP